MNRLEHLLTILGEECAEIQKAASKAKRFGLEDGYPGTDRTNHNDINNELNDLMAVVEMLNCEGLSLHMHTHKREDKKVKVERYLEYAKQQGTLTE